MNLRLLRCLGALLCTGLVDTGFSAPLPCQVLPTPAQSAQIGDWIYRNECNRQRVCLVDWNPGEAFPSLGIGHFIWYPPGVDAGFVESFPLLLAYLAQQHVPLPDWLAQSPLQDHAKLDAPWTDRNEFLAHKQTHKAESLRALLEQHTAEQTAFMLQRLQQAIPTLVKHSATPLALQRKLAALCESPQGWYALMDYVNFKGEGLSPGETYQGQGWGLLQVLQNMEAEGEPTHAFAEAAARILSRRADLAPDAGERERWLPGWLKRVHTYPQQPMLD